MFHLQERLYKDSRANGSGNKDEPHAGKGSFVENASLASIIAPVSEGDFRATYWEKEPLLIQRCDQDFYGDLFTVEDFDRAVSNAPTYVKTAEAKSNKNTRNQGNTTSGLESALGEMRQGATLVLDSLHEREPKLALLCRLLQQQLGHYFQTNIYLTPPNGQGFRPHYDSHDVFVLQVMGSKHWKLENTRRKFPPKNEDMGEEGRFMGEDHRSFVLNQGDMLYIPRGYVHAAECGPEPSMHITLGLIPFTWGELLYAAVKATIQADQRLLEALPLGFMTADGDKLVRGAAAALHKASEEGFLRATVEQYRDELVPKFPLDVSGQISAFFRASELNNEDMVGPRAGIVYRVHQAEHSVRLNFGGRNITFPGFFSEALQFALNNQSYAIRQIAGADLHDDEKLAFVDRLMQEGLLVRK
jgi:ribosomal protein L16 Arg81 hydroxylase